MAKQKAESQLEKLKQDLADSESEDSPFNIFANEYQRLLRAEIETMQQVTPSDLQCIEAEV